MPDGITPTWAALQATTDELIVARGRLAELQMAEKRQRASIIRESQASSVSAQDREADVLTVDLAADIIDARQRIASLDDMRTLLLTAVEQGVELLGRAG